MPSSRILGGAPSTAANVLEEAAGWSGCVPHAQFRPSLNHPASRRKYTNYETSFGFQPQSRGL